MDPRLRKLGASSMADVERHFARYDPTTTQIDVDRSTRLVDAVKMYERMRAGVRGEDRIQVFNPERLLRKVEAEEAMRGAVEEMNSSIGKANLKIRSANAGIRSAIWGDSWVHAGMV
jgi:hypothetical protein